MQGNENAEKTGTDASAHIKPVGVVRVPQGAAGSTAAAPQSPGLRHQ